MAERVRLSDTDRHRGFRDHRGSRYFDHPAHDQRTSHQGGAGESCIQPSLRMILLAVAVAWRSFDWRSQPAFGMTCVRLWITETVVLIPGAFKINPVWVASLGGKIIMFK